MSESKENNEEEEIKIKIMLLGESQIGKTSLIQRYVKNNFNLSYITTVGIDFQLKQIKMNNKSIKLQIWDTAGQERFKNITKSYFHSSDGFIVGYDITSRLSFTNVSTWLKEINDNAPEEIQKILIGNKCDLNEREVTTEEGQKLAEENETRLFIERQKREKQEAEIEKRKMLEQLARDKEERFGKKFDPFTQDAKKKEYTHEENVMYYLKTIKTLYPPFRAGQTLKNCYNTIRIVLSNILKNINEDKFKKVKMTNQNVQERIGKIPLAVKTLNELGFVEEGEFLVVKNVDKDLFDKTIKYLEEEVKKLD